MVLKGSPWRMLRVGTIFIAAHSVLASSQMKHAVEQVVGGRARRGFYRVLYGAQSLGLAAWGYREFRRWPDRTLYRVPPPWSRLMRLGQIASALLMFRSIELLDLGRTTGLAQALAYLRGYSPAPEPEAQGPTLDINGEMQRAWPYNWVRHPGDLALAGMWALFPRMTVNLAVLASMAVVYSLLGALHEESRLRSRYGDAYARYQREVPFMLPRLCPKRRPDHENVWLPLTEKYPPAQQHVENP